MQNIEIGNDRLSSDYLVHVGAKLHGSHQQRNVIIITEDRINNFIFFQNIKTFPRSLYDVCLCRYITI